MPAGRPKKDIVQSQEQDNNPETPVQEKNLTHKAFSIFQGKDGWYVATVMYNPETGEVGDFNKSQAGDKAYAIERFKIDVANTLL